MILTRALEHGWRQRAELHASLMVPSALLLALLDAVQAGRLAAEMIDGVITLEEMTTFPSGGVIDPLKEALAAWRKVVGE